MRILVLGASGMIGHAVFRVLSEKDGMNVFGSVRNGAVKNLFPPNLAESIIAGVELENCDALIKLFGQVRPDVVVNCAGLTKHLLGADDTLASIPINTLIPHRLARVCGLVGARLIHISTDCVFSGKKGNYIESDAADAYDVYGKSKFLGEVDYPHAITLRTSTIGRELQSAHGLLGWFLSQEGQCKGFSRAIFSGLPTVVFAQVIRDFVIPKPELRGLYHVAGRPIAKYDLLCLIAEVYAKSIKIVRDDQFVIDRSLNAERFTVATGYSAPDWPELIRSMHSYQ